MRPSLRCAVALIPLAIAIATPAARADLDLTTVTVGFDRLLVLPTGTTLDGVSALPFGGEYRLTASILPGDPSYAGSPGILADGLPFALGLRLGPDDLTFYLDSVSIEVAPTASASIGWGVSWRPDEVSPAVATPPAPAWTWTGTASPGVTTLTYNTGTPTPANTLWIVQQAGDGAQLLSVTITGQFGIVPEPSSAVPCVFAAVAWGVVRRLRCSPRRGRR